jgi:type I restriction enzyme, S subunit
VSEWQEVSLGEVTNKIGSGATPKGGGESYKDSGISLIRSQNVLDFKFSKSGLAFIDNSQAHELRNVSVEKDDVLLNITGDSVARCCVVPQDILPARVNQHVAIIRANKEIADTHYIFYSLQTLKEELLMQSEIGATRNALTKGMLESLKLSIPALEEQKAIASVLSSLDDKIDLLHRQNTTLEAMAETLFRQWFVEEALDSNIGQFIDLQNGYAFKSQDFKGIGEQRVLKIKNISGGIIDLNNTDFIDSAVANKTDAKFKVLAGDVLFAMTGAEIGKLGIVPKTNTPLWLNQRVGLLKEKYKGARFLAYLQLNSEIGQDYIENSATGSAQPNISGSLIEQCPFPKIEASRVKECGEILDVYYQKLISNLGQIQSLEKLRDNLLPKLTSGEVRLVNG